MEATLTPSTMMNTHYSGHLLHYIRGLTPFHVLKATSAGYLAVFNGAYLHTGLLFDVEHWGSHNVGF